MSKEYKIPKKVIFDGVDHNSNLTFIENLQSRIKSLEGQIKESDDRHIVIFDKLKGLGIQIGDGLGEAYYTFGLHSIDGSKIEIQGKKVYISF